MMDPECPPTIRTTIGGCNEVPDNELLDAENSLSAPAGGVPRDSSSHSSTKKKERSRLHFPLWKRSMFAPSGAIEAENEEWNCEHCSYRNCDSGNNACAICGSNRIDRVINTSIKLHRPSIGSQRQSSTSWDPAMSSTGTQQGSFSSISTQETVQTSNTTQQQIAGFLNIAEVDVTQTIRSFFLGAEQTNEDTAIVTELQENEKSPDTRPLSPIEGHASMLSPPAGNDPNNQSLAVPGSSSTVSSTCPSSNYDEPRIKRRDAIVTETSKFPNDDVNDNEAAKRPSRRILKLWLMVGLLSVILLGAGGITVALVMINGDSNSSTDMASTPEPVSPIENTNTSTQSPTGPLPSAPPTNVEQTGQPTHQTPSTSPTSSPITTAPSQSVADNVLTVVPLGSKAIIGEKNLDEFGRVSLSRNGTILAVGAPNAETSPGTRPGRAQVFQYDMLQEKWIHFGQDLEAKSDMFGSRVVLSDDGTTVSVSGRKTDTEDGLVVVYRYSRETEKWVRLGQELTILKVPNLDPLRLGQDRTTKPVPLTVSLSGQGNVVALGTERRVEAFAFNTRGNTWTKLGQPLHGRAVSLSQNGMSMAVGSAAASGNVVPNAFVQVYDYDSQNRRWAPRGKQSVLHVPGTDQLENFGSPPLVSLSESSDIVVMSTDIVNNEKAPSSHVQVFRFNPESRHWDPIGQTLMGGGIAAATDNNSFIQLLTRNDELVVSFLGPNNIPLFFQYEQSTDSWNELVLRLQDNGINNDGQVLFSGIAYSVGRDGTVMAVGDALFDQGRGQVNTFQLLQVVKANEPF